MRHYRRSDRPSEFLQHPKTYVYSRFIDACFAAVSGLAALHPDYWRIFGRRLTIAIVATLPSCKKTLALQPEFF